MSSQNSCSRFKAVALQSLIAVVIILTLQSQLSAFQLISSTTLNGSADMRDIGHAITTDANGNIWVTGETAEIVGANNVWIAKYNSSLVLQSSITIDGANSDVEGVEGGNGIIVDASNNVWAIGYVNETGGLGTAIWIAKYTTSLVLQASTTIEGLNCCTDWGSAIVSDAAGNIWAVGAVDDDAGEITNVWIAKYNSSLVFQSSTTVNGSGNAFDTAYDIEIDSNGDIWVTGHVFETGEDKNIWIAKYNSSLVLQASTTVNGSANSLDIGYGIAFSSNGYAYVTGYIDDTGSGRNIWVAKYDSSLTLQASETFSSAGNDADRGHAIAIDSRGEIYLTGVVSEASGGANIWIAKYNASLVFQSSTTLDGAASGTDQGFGITTDSNGNILVSGGITETGEDYNIWIAKYANDTRGPDPPSGLTAVALDGRTIRLGWLPSPSTNVAHYNIYFDNGTGFIDYEVLLSSVSSSSTLTFTADPLVDGVTYKFGVRAVDDNGVEELNTSVIASATAFDVSTAPVKAAIKVPQSGQKLSGNRMLVMAEIIQGTIANVKNVRFQYRNSISTTNPWVDIVPASNQHPNPDTDSPYFVHWDISAFSEGVYELRAVATSRADVTDASPPTIFVTIDHADPEVEEIASGAGVQKRQKVNNALSSSIDVGDIQSGNLTQITLPATALNDSTATLKVVTSPTGVPAVPEDLSSTGIVRDITLESGQTTLNTAATLTLSYPDSNSDGLVDGTTVRTDKLAIYTYNTTSAQWQKDFSSTIDAANKTVTGATPHFSLFALIAPAAADLSDVLVYPVPWVPNDGNADNGKTFNTSDSDSGIIFDNLTRRVKIEIYTVTGERILEFSSDTSSGKVQWDGRNQGGRDVASGGYFVVITDTGSGTKVVRKIAIIR